ncbi:MAG: AraC family transcriptional regulator [Lachnospiraceae bacterium]|nr:AraC family transcriptional regulator [Lachnospiraceae bacterium]
MQPLDLYEHKIISDPEFPVQLHINDISSKRQYFSPHWHEHIELHYVREGKTLLRLNQREIWAEKGNLVIANSNELHAGYCDGSHMEVLVMIFEMEAFSKELADKNVIFQPLIKKDEVIDDIMSEIYREYSSQRIGYRLVCKGELLRLIAHLVREYTVEFLTERESDRRKKQLERLNLVLDYIQSNYTRQIGNGELADVLHLSEDRFNHLFKESMGMAPLQYINEVRIKKAMNLLKKKEGTVAEIADSVGFSDYNHFGRQFRRYYGCAPSEILKR